MIEDWIYMMSLKRINIVERFHTGDIKKKKIINIILFLKKIITFANANLKMHRVI